MSFVRRKATRVTESDGGRWDGADPWCEAHPFLTAFLALGQYEDGANRKTGTLLCFVDAGCLKACISDRDNGEVAFVSSRSFEGLLDALETGLREASLDWRSASGGKNKRR